MAFRVASWRDQRAAQGDLKIAMENDSNFMAFIRLVLLVLHATIHFNTNLLRPPSNKSISNRKKFAKHLRDVAEVSELDSLQFLRIIHSIISQMHSPCLRLELLQYILGLDNRYSGKLAPVCDFDLFANLVSLTFSGSRSCQTKY